MLGVYLLNVLIFSIGLIILHVHTYLRDEIHKDENYSAVDRWLGVATATLGGRFQGAAKWETK
jgi:hypothetical protein